MIHENDNAPNVAEDSDSATHDFHTAEVRGIYQDVYVNLTSSLGSSIPINTSDILLK